MSLDLAREREWAVHRLDCWTRFDAAVRAAQSGSYNLGKALIERVRAAAGDEVAERVRRELKACAAEWKA